MPRVFVGSSDANSPTNAMVLHPDVVPQWLITQFEPKALKQEYAALHRALDEMRQALSETKSLTLRETAVLRSLIVHSWRRLVLRHPDLPKTLYSENWRGHDCRALVSELLNTLLKPDVSQILLD